MALATTLDFVQGILSIYISIKKLQQTLQSNEAAMSALLKEVLVYEGLIKEELQILQTPTRPGMDPHHDAICLFHEGINGLHNVLIDYTSQDKGIFRRAYNFCASWCSAPENAAKIQKYSQNITRAVNVMNYSGIVTLEQKTAIIIAQGKELKKSLDETLELFRTSGKSEVFAQQISKLLKVGIDEVKHDLRRNHNEIKIIIGEGFGQMDKRFDELSERLDALMNALRIPGDHLPAPSLSDTIRAPEALQFWTDYFGQSQQVTLLEMRGVSSLRHSPPPVADRTPILARRRRRRRPSPGASRGWRRRSPAP
jgi:hypothetical protein